MRAALASHIFRNNNVRCCASTKALYARAYADNMLCSATSPISMAARMIMTDIVWRPISVYSTPLGVSMSVERKQRSGKQAKCCWKKKQATAYVVSISVASRNVSCSAQLAAASTYRRVAASWRRMALTAVAAAGGEWRNVAGHRETMRRLLARKYGIAGSPSRHLAWQKHGGQLNGENQKRRRCAYKMFVWRNAPCTQQTVLSYLWRPS